MYEILRTKSPGDHQELYQKVVETVPLVPFRTELTFVDPLKNLRIKETLGSSDFPELRDIRMSDFLQQGYLIEGGLLKIFSFMKSEVYLSSHEDRGSVLIHISGDLMGKVDPEGKIEKWWRGLEKKYCPKDPD